LLAGIVVFLVFVFQDPVGTAHALSTAWHRIVVFIDNV
jgi:hypothetical protein